MTENIKPKLPDNMSSFEPTVKPPTNQFKKLPDETILEIIAHAGTDQVVAFGQTDQRHRGLSVADARRWGDFGVHPPLILPAAPPVVVNRRIKSLKPYVQAAIPHLIKPLNIFSNSEVEIFSNSISGMNDYFEMAHIHQLKGDFDAMHAFLKDMEICANKAGVFPENIIRERYVKKLNNLVEQVRRHPSEAYYHTMHAYLKEIEICADKAGVAVPVFPENFIREGYVKDMNDYVELARGHQLEGNTLAVRACLKEIKIFANFLNVPMPTL